MTLILHDQVNSEVNQGPQAFGVSDSEDPDVIPLHVTGTIDTDLSTITSNEMMAWGLRNLWKDGKEGAYAVRHGRQPVNDFGKPLAGDSEHADSDRPNFIEKAFPFTAEKLQQACREEEQKLPISDPAPSSDFVAESVVVDTGLSSPVESISIIINPIDIHDPIAQIFAGENIDLDNFIAGLGPDSKKRPRNIAADPYAVAKFFHFMIRTIPETLFGIKGTPFQVRESNDGSVRQRWRSLGPWLSARRGARPVTKLNGQIPPQSLIEFLFG
ncbi:hypothetical protein B0H13DRAFT_2319761 [Mycena leptocephala]|nr:hypothetical protein B0H13DRAFT_2319761 [Mycena leptocephala]